MCDLCKHLLKQLKNNIAEFQAILTHRISSFVSLPCPRALNVSTQTRKIDNNAPDMQPLGLTIAKNARQDLRKLIKKNLACNHMAVIHKIF